MRVRWRVRSAWVIGGRRGMVAFVFANCIVKVERLEFERGDHSSSLQKIRGKLVFLRMCRGVFISSAPRQDFQRALI